MKEISTLLFFLLSGIMSFGQFNPATNSYDKIEMPDVSLGKDDNAGAFAGLNGIDCIPNSFWGIAGGQIVSFTLNGNIVTNNGNVIQAAGGSLAYCNNLDGGSFSPTFYTNSTSTKAAYYNGTVWITCSAPPASWILNTGGNGNFLYFTSNDSVTYDQIGITRYNGSSYTNVYTLSDTSRAITVADIVADEAGNVWFFIGNHTSLASDTLNVVSAGGVLLKQFPFQFNTYNAYGCFMMNGILYIGLGGSNQDHPFTLIPVTISNNTAVAGTPIPMPAINLSDLASCTPGSPLAIFENPELPLFHIYPNPAKDQLYIEFVDPNAVAPSVKIYNSLGTIVFQENIHSKSETIDISNLSAGFYYVTIDKYCQKFIKQ